ncbi:hypothetical protein R3W88_010302 [Solanum pinnatisectum]|uniref:RING-type E3 ubiquitin transferase (cysteine targeting) n=1 Tax=Solanum pinnatisectum TaxID=50273 RepID=A0AAV9MDV1_9SOLN|nr:hypothetical protein R3W88_010302 [Solanum pinnatisectum]
MSAMLKEQLVKVFSLMKPGMLFQYEPELDAFLEFLIWRFSIWVDKPTPGNALINLRYRACIRTGLEGPGLTVSQKIWYYVATIGGQYIYILFFFLITKKSRSLARRAWLLIQRMEGIYKAASFSNILLFLCTGRYRNLIERALRARLVYGSPNTNRAVSFEYMNRQLVWNEFSIIFHPLAECCRFYMELLLLLLPLLNSSSIKNFLRPFSKDKSSDSSVDDTLCPICQGKPTIPFLAIPCQHSYCYYCLQTRCSTAPFCCPRCGESIAAMQRHGGSVQQH